MPATPLTVAEFEALGLTDWRHDAGAIVATFRAGSFPAAGAFALALAELAEDRNHHPDLEIRYPDRVVVRCTTHSAGGLTSLDAELARAVSQLAAERGVTPESPAG